MTNKLAQIQSELKAPKSQFNSFGKYKYRNCEDVLEAVKPHLVKHDLTLTISDEIREAGALLYVEATARITDGENFVSVTAQAGIDPNRKGMDIAQSFGSSSSYARKYALNGLFLIDDSRDPDTTNNHEARPATDPKVAIAAIQKTTSVAEMTAYYNNLDPAAKKACLETCKSHKAKLQNPTTK